MKIAVIGCGYVGLVTGICLAELGHNVLCIDNDIVKIGALKQGRLPIHEKDLPKIFQQVEIEFSEDIRKALTADLIFIAVGTPANEDGSCDISKVLEVAEQLKGKRIAIKSTVPVGTAKKVAAVVDRSVISNPEFLCEGNAVYDFMNPDRIVVGCDSDASIMIEVYTGLTTNLVFTSNESAELIKYASNAFLAVKLAYINEMAWFAQQVGANIEDVALGMGMDKRIGDKFLKAGPGFGGSCFPKDLASLNHQSSSLEIVNLALQSNAAHQNLCAQKIMDASNGRLAVLGATFKANTNDIRESPALSICKLLPHHIQMYDPQYQTVYNSPYEAAGGADALVILTEWPEFADLDFDILKSVMHGRIIVDLRNLYEFVPGFEYHSMGRATVNLIDGS